MDLETWVSLTAIGGFAIAILASLRSFRNEVRDEVQAGFAHVHRRLDVLEQRTFDLCSRDQHRPPH